MTSLFTYTIPVDDGAAPNPFNGLCSLAICKPAIRKSASKGDWVAGLGSKNAPSGNLSGRLVYAMCVQEVLTLEQYDQRSKSEWPHRIPKTDSANLWERLGDCIYDYSVGRGRQRPGVHGIANIETDLSGKNVLISTDFYYFGRNAIPIPKALQPICHQTQGHRSRLNAPYLEQFVQWIRSLPFQPGKMHGWPDFTVNWDQVIAHGGCQPRQLDDEREEK